jgi:hypothetical protein
MNLVIPIGAAERNLLFAGSSGAAFEKQVPRGCRRSE